MDTHLACYAFPLGHISHIVEAMTYQGDGFLKLLNTVAIVN